jgi:hypothetical protein
MREQQAFDPRGSNSVNKIRKITRPATVVAIASLLLACAAHAEDAWEIMTGGMAPQYSSQPSSMAALSYGANPTIHFPPRSRAATRAAVQPEASGAYCVRTCDGRYFPVPSGDNQSSADGCKNLCPASETRVFSGSSIDNASSKDGKAYSALPNAFRYRKELVAGCTCNGKDVIGLASVSLNEDRTLRRGDIVANAGGLEVVNRVDEGHLSFAKASPAMRSKYERLPVLASD